MDNAAEDQSLEEQMLGGDQDQQEGAEQEATQEEQQNEAQLSPDQERAIGDGWTDKEEWENRGNDPDDWVSAKKFNERGNMIGQIKSLQSRSDRQQQDFDRRLNSLNKLHDAQQKQTISDLEGKRTQAVQDADVDEVNRIQGQIDEVRSSADPESDQDAGGKPAAMVDWEKNNAWINERSPKASYAKDSWNHYISQGLTDTSEILAAVDADVAKAFPPRNPNRDNAPMQETNRSRPGKRQERGLQWSDLTRDEVSMYNGMRNAFKDKDDFLQAVTDSRKS